MGRAQKKTGKGRLDKYYKLAKEQGYRARSAFKLIQLNKKYSILEKSRCTIDLCAAPGGWLQVASKYMPSSSIIIGVDLVPIKPIPRVVTFTADITTSQCRNLIRNELKDWKADVVLHDGAPNVGTAWIQDAYSQSELVLMSLKLAVEFLAKGGTFVTKVFRSVDYNNLIWVFNQLFRTVEATKPPSSRNVSAEIFVVCKEYLAPKYIDPKFLDPKHVFNELSTEGKEITNADKAQANVFHPEKKRRHRDGYADGDYTLFKTLPASSFICGNDPVFALGGANKITFLTDEEKKWLSFDLTTEDVESNCEDLKVLGKGDFKTLIKWRAALREELGLDVKMKDTEDATEHTNVVEIDEEQEISAELERLNSEAAARTKRERRKTNEIRSKTIQRMQLKMTAPMDIGLDQQDLSLRTGQEDIFDIDTKDGNLRKTLRRKLVIDDEEGDIVVSSEDEAAYGMESREETMAQSRDENEQRLADLEAELDDMYEAYQDRLREKDAKHKIRAARDLKMDKWNGIENGDSGFESGEEEETPNGWDTMQRAKMQDSDTDDSASGSEEEPKETTKKRTRFEENAVSMQKRRRLSPTFSDVKTTTSAAAKLWFSQDMFGRVKGLHQLDDSDYEGHGPVDASKEELSPPDAVCDDEDPVSDDFEVVAQDQNDALDVWDDDQEDHHKKIQTRIDNFGLTTPEAMTLAQQLVNREKTKTQLINEGFNRYSLNSKDGLPSWFLDDEAKYYKLNLPVTKEAMAALRAKARALDARPIKKVAEAKARKKLKAAQRLEKAKKKAEGVNTTSDMSEREKAQAIDKLMHKGLSKGSQKKDIKLVVAKGMHRGVKGRPKGVKGRYVMVDSRMKKELRANKRKEKAIKKRR